MSMLEMIPREYWLEIYRELEPLVPGLISEKTLKTHEKRPNVQGRPQRDTGTTHESYNEKTLAERRRAAVEWAMARYGNHKND